MEKIFDFEGKQVRLTAYGDCAIRVRMSEKPDSESLFDRYNLYRKPDGSEGISTENGLSAGSLTVTFESGVLTFGTDRFTRKLDIRSTETAAVKAYFNEVLDGMRRRRNSSSVRMASAASAR